MNPHQQHPTSPLEIARSFWRNRGVIWQLTRREVVGRYRGSVIGLAWSFFNPILMLAVYTFVFSVVFKARWGVGDEGNVTNFAIFLFVGIIVHGLFAECVNRAPNLILSNVNLVKKVIFPLDVLPWVALGSACFHAGISLVVLLLAQLIINQWIPWTAVLLPLIVLPLVLTTMGFAWFLAATGVFVRDIGHTTGIFTTVLLFISPVFYPISALPEKFQVVVKINPLTFVIEEARKVLILSHAPDFGRWIMYFGCSILIAWAGFWWFQKTRKGFADVL